MISPEQLATLLGVSTKTVYRNWREWGLKGYRIGNGIRFRKPEVEKWIEGNRI